jgi:Transposase DDE domain
MSNQGNENEPTANARTENQPKEHRQVIRAKARAAAKAETGKERFVRGRGSKTMQRAMRITRMDEPIEDLGDGWFEVPSEQGKGIRYKVYLGADSRCEVRMNSRELMPPTDDGDDDSCECKAFRKEGFCKHILAASVWNATRIKGRQPKIKERIQKYKNPKDYDEKKTREMRCVNEMIRCIAGVIDGGRRFSKGRKPKPLADAVREILYQANSAKASRKAISEPSLLVRRAFLDETMAYTTRLRYMKDGRVKNAIRALLDVSTEEIRQRTSRFSIDSTTLRAPASRFDTIEKVRRKVVGEDGKVTKITEMVVKQAVNCKLHIAIANESKMIVAAEVTDENVNDTEMFESLFRHLASRFVVKAVQADAGYNWPANYEMVGAHHGDPFIDFADDDRGQGKGNFPTMDRMWKIYTETYHDVWKPDYNPRQCVECVNAMIKRNSYRRIRAKTREAREVEILALCLIHNLAQLARLWEDWNLQIRWLDDRAVAVLRGEEVLGLRPEEPDDDLDDEDAFGSAEAA